MDEPGRSPEREENLKARNSDAAPKAAIFSGDDGSRSRPSSLAEEQSGLSQGVDESFSERGDEVGVAGTLHSGKDSPQESSTTYASRVPLNELDEKNQTSNGSYRGKTSTKGSGSSRDKKEKDAKSIHKMHRFSLYETHSWFYFVGGDLADKHFRILKIDRTAPPGQLNFVEDNIVYSKREINELLSTVDHGNKNNGGLKLKCNSWGLLGFIRFTEAYYMLLITKKQQVAMVGGHFIHQVDGTELVPLLSGPSSKYQSNRNPQEQRFLAILNNLHLHRSFYFSYSYNVTQTLQHNVIRNTTSKGAQETEDEDPDFNGMFMWNHHLLAPAVEHLKKPYDWCVPIIHGFVDQSAVDVFGRSIYITLIARRSRFFAGARFLKRGVNDLGYVANDVETEQIVSEMMTTSLDAPGHRILRNPSYTSFVQHRGSIPLYWTQDNTGVSPKPGIELTFIDPFYASAALHFDDLFRRYGAPITVLNLVKSRERTPRETKLLVEYQNAIAYLNQPLPKGKKILYRAFDMARAAKTRGQDVISSLETIAEDLVTSTGFFHNGVDLDGRTSVQNGVTRSNCIDCLDRTNACQFVIGKTAFALQLQSLGLIGGDTINYDTDASNILAHMYNDHGDTLASQYGGSHLVNTTESYRKINNWQSHSRDMLESFKRYYHNSFLDSQRQEAYNLFLGNYIYASGQPMLWELPSDYYLHHASPTSWGETQRRDYYQWFTPRYLEPRTFPVGNTTFRTTCAAIGSLSYDDWWQEYYKPGHFTSFMKTFAYRMNTTTRYLPKPLSSNLDVSPFVIRQKLQDFDTKSVDRGQIPEEKQRENSSQTTSSKGKTKRITSLQHWLHGGAGNKVKPDLSREGINEENETAEPLSNSFTPADKTLKNQWTLKQFYDDSLHPTISQEEGDEYREYISHPLKLPLVPSAEANTSKSNIEFEEYIESAEHIGTAPLDYGTLEGTVEYERWLTGVPNDPLCVREDDLDKKRYQAYRKWVKGKSLFKQSKIDPEFVLSG